MGRSCSIPRLVPAGLVALALVGTASVGAAPTAGHGVYQYVVVSAKGAVDDVAGAIERAANATHWRHLASVAAGAPEGCHYRARVLVLYDAEYAAGLLKANRKTGPFAALDRVNVFEDERGVHVAVVNPRSINRTILLDDPRQDAPAAAHLESLRAMIQGAVEGTPGSRDFGEVRSKGYIGRTMGIMAGGPFDEKIQEVAVVGGGDWAGVAERVASQLQQPGPRWGMRLSYRLDLPELELAVLGATGTPMDSKSFSIVRAGADSARAALACPGLAHAGAYPIEIVVAKEGETVRVRLVDTMYRMKMYFEDAGKWAFMKNMGMPGSIYDELQEKIRTATRS